MEVTDGNDGALAAGATMQLFVRTPETSHVVGTNRPHKVLNRSTQEYGQLVHFTKRKRAGPRGGTELVDMGLQPTKLLLRLTKQLLVQQTVSVVATLPSNRPFLWPRAGLASDTSMFGVLYHRSFFSCMGNAQTCDINPSWTEKRYRACTCMEPRQ